MDPFLIQFTENFGIRWYSLAYLAGFFMSYVFIKKWLINTKTTPLTEKHLMDFIVWVAVGVIVGARCGYALFYSPSLLTQWDTSFPFWGLLKIHTGGLSSHGGIFGLTVAVALFTKKHRMSFFHGLDLTVLGASVGIFFGRLANFINGELFGRVIEGRTPLAVQFPKEMLLWVAQKKTNFLMELEEAIQALKGAGTASRWQEKLYHFESTGEASGVYTTIHELIKACEAGKQEVIAALSQVLSYRHPSQIYQAFWEGLLPFLIVWWVWRSRPRRAGLTASLWMLTYALMRMVGEQFRMPDVQLGFRAWGLTRGQWLSVAMLVWVGLCFFLVWKNKKPEKWGGWAFTQKNR